MEFLQKLVQTKNQAKILKVAFIQKGLVNYFPELKFWLPLFAKTNKKLLRSFILAFEGHLSQKKQTNKRAKYLFVFVKTIEICDREFLTLNTLAIGRVVHIV